MRFGRSFLASVLFIAAPASATNFSVSVGRLKSEKTCSLYKMTAGHHREAGAYSPYGGAYASDTAWIDYLIRDCVDHFASLRTSLQAALASSGKIVVSAAGSGAYVVEGRISEVSGGGPADPASDSPDVSYAISSSDLFVNMDVTLKNARGQIIYGGLLTKKIETGFSMQTGGLSTSTRRSGQALYTELQHEVALAVARVVTFKLAPLKVTSVVSNRVRLNYGSPLLQQGTLVQVVTQTGAVVRYNVVGAGQGSSLAEYQGGGDASEVTPGSVAAVIEDEDPASSARRFEKVDLP